MHKNTKAAFAATTAAVLLLGGAGTLASWNDSESISGGAIKSGKLSLAVEADQGCGTWTMDGGTEFVAGITLVVPGDVITRTCTYTVHAAGAHLAATAGLSSPSFATGSNATLVSKLATDADYSLDDSDVLTPADPVALADGAAITSADNGKVLTALVSVTFDETTSGTTAQDVTATLDDLSVSLTHNHA